MAESEDNTRRKIKNTEKTKAELDEMVREGKQIPRRSLQFLATYESRLRELHEMIPRDAEYATEEYRREKEEEQAKERIQARIKEMPWELPEGAVSESSREFMRTTYDSLVTGEQRPPNPEDKIRVPGGIKEGSTEFQLLKQAGLSNEQIAARSFTRKQLLDAGFLFVNRIGDGQKALINAEIPSPSDPDQMIDYSQRSLLTRDEIQTIYDYQQAHGLGLQGHDLAQVRADMLLFLYSFKSGAPFKSRADLGNHVMPRGGTDADWLTGTPEDHQRVLDTFGSFSAADLYFADAATSSRDKLQPNLSLDRIIETDGMTAAGEKIMGRNSTKGATINERTGKLATTPHSPFLDSGYTFTHNEDILVETPDPENKFQRINVASIHVAGAHPDFPGFSEMGKGVDWDQTYLTVGDYVKYFYPPEQTHDNVEDAEEDGRLTRRERIQAEDMLTLDPQDLRKRVILNGQKHLIAEAKAH
jgi:hypothetical protein